MFVIKSDIQEAAGSNQLCGGQIAGIEAAFHSAREQFNHEISEAMLLVDASNAFNSLNRANALLNMRSLCPPFSTVLTNIYRESSELFLGASTLHSQEGTTQGDPLAMPFYALVTRPLIDMLDSDLPDLRQIWYADDATAVGKLSDLKSWWDKLTKIGPSFGYFVNPKKTWLVTKDSCLPAASSMFDESSVNITTDGRPILGSPVGKVEYISTFVKGKVKEWVREVEKLSDIADSQPHAAYGAITHGFTSKWAYLSRTTPDIGDLLLPLEHAIRTSLLPKLSGRDAPSDIDRCLFALQTRLGGLNIANPAAFAQEQFNNSKLVTKPLVDLVVAKNNCYPFDFLEEQIDAKSKVKTKRREQTIQAAGRIRESLPQSLQYAMDLAREKGASSWLTVTQTFPHNFYIILCTCFTTRNSLYLHCIALYMFYNVPFTFEKKNQKNPYGTKMVAGATPGASVHNGQRDRVSVLS